VPPGLCLHFFDSASPPAPLSRQDDFSDEFTLPSEVEALKAEVLNGRTWSLNLELPEPGSPAANPEGSPIAEHDSPSRRPMSSISSSVALRRPLIRAPPTHRDNIFILGYIANWAVLLVAHGLGSARPSVQHDWVDATVWVSALHLAVLLGSSLGAMVGTISGKHNYYNILPDTMPAERPLATDCSWCSCRWCP